MQKLFGGISGFNPSGRFQGVGGQSQQSPPADPAAAQGLPPAPPAQPPDPNTGGAAAPPAPPTGAPSAPPASGAVDLSKLIQNLQKLNIASEPTHPKVPTLAEALRKHFGDQAKIDVDNQTIKITTPQGVRQLEVYTRRSQGNVRAHLRLRVDKNTTRPIGQLLRYGDEYYIDADLLEKIDKTPKSAQKQQNAQQPTDDKKPKRKLPKSVLYGAGLLAAGGAVAGLSRFLGGGDDDDDKKKAQSENGGGTGPLGTQVREVIQLKPANNNQDGTESEKRSVNGKQNSAEGGPNPAKGEPPSVTVTERTQTQPNIVVNVPAPQVIREITSGEAPVQTRRKDNETVVKAGTSDGVFTLNIGADKTLILKDKDVVGEFPTSEIIRAVGQMADGKTEKEIRRSGEFDDLLKNPWFLVAIALALVAFTRRGGRE